MQDDVRALGALIDLNRETVERFDNRLSGAFKGGHATLLVIFPVRSRPI